MIFLIISGNEVKILILSSEFWEEDLKNLSTYSKRSLSVNSLPNILEISPIDAPKGIFIFSSFSFAILIKHGFNLGHASAPKNCNTAGKLKAHFCIIDLFSFFVVLNSLIVST